MCPEKWMGKRIVFRLGLCCIACGLFMLNLLLAARRVVIRQCFCSISSKSSSNLATTAYSNLGNFHVKNIGVYF